MSLGLLFLKRTDKQGWFRIIVTIFSITLATAVLLSAIAMGEAMLRGEKRSQYVGIPHDNRYRSEKVVDKNADELALYRYYNYNLGTEKTITEIAMRQLTPKAPLFPGMTKAPAKDEVFVLPALAKLIREDSQFKNYFGDLKIVENVPDEILLSPDSLVALTYMPEEMLDKNPQFNLAFLTQEQIDNYKPEVSKKLETVIKTFMLVCGLGLAFPLLILIVSATRIGVMQRQRRYAALSLIGTSKGQINRILVTEALAAGVFGVVIGTGLYEIARHTILAKLDLAGDAGRYFLDDITVTPIAFLGAELLILLLVVVVNWWAMRKVKTSPLGVMHKQKLREKPGIWRLLPLVIVFGVLYHIKHNLGGVNWTAENAQLFTAIMPALFLLMMVALLLAGSYLTKVFAIIMDKLSRKPVGVMSSKRLKVFPRTIFSSVSGIVLAIFVGSFFITSVETAKLTTYKLFDEEVEMFYTKFESDSKDYTIEFSENVVSGELIDLHWLNEQLMKNNELKSLVQKTYDKHYYYDEDMLGAIGEIYTCKDLAEYTTLKCEDGLTQNQLVVVKKVYDKSIQDSRLEVEPVGADAMKYTKENPENIVYYFRNSADLQKATTLVSNFLANHARKTGEQINFNTIDRTNAKQISYLFDNFKSLIDAIYVGTIATILIGGFSLATATIGSFFERKHSFANLRLMGVSMKTLNRVVLVESIVPLLIAGAGALVAGVWLSWTILGLMIRNLHTALPEPSYFIGVGVAFVVSILIIISILPILKRITSSEENRTE